MNAEKAVNWLLCYDIADPQRLQKVHGRVSKQGLMVQYSVYYLRASAAQVEALLHSLTRLIEPREDDIRVYPLPENPAACLEGHDGIARSILGGDGNETAGWFLFGDGEAGGVATDKT